MDGIGDLFIVCCVADEPSGLGVEIQLLEECFREVDFRGGTMVIETLDLLKVVTDLVLNESSLESILFGKRDDGHWNAAVMKVLEGGHRGIEELC